MVSIAAGELNRRVTLQRIKTNATPDAHGHIDETADSTWESIGDRWAKFWGEGSREFFRAKQIQADMSHLIDLRYDGTTSTLTPRDRIRYDGRTLHILSARDAEEAHVVMRVEAKETR